MQRPDMHHIPTDPGVYRFVASDARVLYVGKARRLRNRLGSYFSGVTHPRTTAMLAEAADVDWLVCASESEALLVEAALIRELQPPYNVRLRDERDAYPYVALSQHPISRLTIWHGPARRVRRFGPYPSPSHARGLIEAVEQVWQLRTCNDRKLEVHQRLGRGCLLADLGRCCAPCVDPDGYPERVAAAAALLDGEVGATLDVLGAEMQAAVAERAFESAAVVRDRIGAVRALTDRAVPTEVAGVVDALGLAGDDVGGAAQLLRVRDGALRGCPTVILDPALHAQGVADSLDGFDGPVTGPNPASPPLGAPGGAAAIGADPQLVAMALLDLYGDAVPAPLVLVPGDADPDVVTALSRATPGVRIRRPRTPGERALVVTATENAIAALARARLRRQADPATRRLELAALAEGLGLGEPPLRLECLDISHFAGSGTVAALSVLEEGVPRPSLYRRFRLMDRNDDPASIAEAVTRRVTHLAPDAAGSDTSLAARPGLLLIDGGPTQLSAAAQACAAAGIEVTLAALSKRLEEVWLPGCAAPVHFALDSTVLYLLQRARDEAHRSALAYQRRLRGVDTDPLGGIEGLGPRRRARLLDEAGSLGALREWPRARYALCSWLPSPVADAVYARLRD
jgi:excinuclease ABC subunit C